MHDARISPNANSTVRSSAPQARVRDRRFEISPPDSIGHPIDHRDLLDERFRMTKHAVVIDNENWFSKKQVESNFFPTVLPYVFSEEERKPCIPANRRLCGFAQSQSERIICGMGLSVYRGDKIG